MIRPTDVGSLTDFKRNTPEELRRLRESGRPRVLIINGKPAVIVQDAEAYERLLDAADHAEAVAGIKRGLEDARAGRMRPAKQAIDALRRQLRRRRSA